ncbi:MAG: NAD(P)-dependent oxidoreductase [bacterium]|nr:NAD(P)-dependent oxidoreductase [bacterium]
MRIAFFELEGWEERRIRDEFHDHEVVLTSARMTADALPAERSAEVASVFVDSRVTAEVLAAFPNLKFIVTRSTGYDHVDVAACRARGVGVGYVPGYGDNTVAEYAFGLLLMLTRKLYPAVDRVKEQHSFAREGLRGTDLKGKMLGVIGTGRIGTEAIKIGQGFGMQVVAFDPFPNLAYAAENRFTYLTLNELLAASDVVTVHCPLTPQTRHLLNRENLLRVKRGCYLVNTARGPIVETTGIVAALEAGRLAGVALDVLEEEGEIKDEMHFLAHAHPKAEELEAMLATHALIAQPNVLVTPHNAFNSQEAFGRILATTTQTIRGFLEGKPVNLVP